MKRQKWLALKVVAILVSVLIISITSIAEANLTLEEKIDALSADLTNSHTVNTEVFGERLREVLMGCAQAAETLSAGVRPQYSQHGFSIGSFNIPKPLDKIIHLFNKYAHDTAQGSGTMRKSWIELAEAIQPMLNADEAQGQHRLFL